MLFQHELDIDVGAGHTAIIGGLEFEGSYCRQEVVQSSFEWFYDIVQFNFDLGFTENCPDSLEEKYIDCVYAFVLA